MYVGYRYGSLSRQDFGSSAHFRSSQPKIGKLPTTIVDIFAPTINNQSVHKYDRAYAKQVSCVWHMDDLILSV